ncbi:division/outer membrane stress-associated lipid-binding lipoprotein [Gallaecimonas sp. GXIMD4217]|uniref:division/outer membrane stress-associated lipid-binding lipoprotein n=1 Tax=Gallaecimonas sp. GXIMD4217 TaxID=3131927 RepID=UPI00311ACAFB
MNHKLILSGLLATCLLLEGCAAAVVAGAAGTAVVANDRRTVGAQLDDESIELKISGLIAGDPTLRKQTHITAVSMDGEVLLVGQAPGEQLRSQILNGVRTIPGVRKIHNQIRLMTPTRMGTRTHDTWLTSVIKGKLLAAGDLDSSAVKVVTENSEVFLMGLVNRQEAELATEIARNVSGVTKVVKVFQYQ